MPSLARNFFRDARRRAPLFLRTFLVVSLVYLAVWLSSVYSDAAADFEQRSTRADAKLDRVSAVLDATLKTYAADTMIVAHGRNLNRFAAGNRGARAAVVQDFATVAVEKPMFVQIRYLDRTGQERVRVDRRGADVAAVETSKLQNKADRYYFRESIGLPPGALYVSPIDLNVENGVVEQPWNPMLRLATPIYAGGSRAQGVVVVNIAVSQLLELARRGDSAFSAPIQILNKDGYWLAGAPADRLWGFMFDRPASMAVTSPADWKRIAGASSGAFDSGGARYLFAAVRAQAGGATPDAMVRASDEWKLLAVVPNVSLAALSPAEWLTPVAVLLFIALICWGWSGATIAGRDAERERRQVEETLANVEKLASLGRLVAGVAHELNTPIGNAITVSSTLAARAAEMENAVRSGQLKRSSLDAFVEHLRNGTGIIQRSLDRAATLIGHFKQVAVDQTSDQRRTFELADLLADIVGAVRPQFRGDAIVLEVSVDAKAQMDSYPGPLGQVLFNLVANARLHGFGEGDRGVVSIAARDASPQEVELVVRDTGRGVPPEVKDKIFEPFFTTRHGSGGTGLGLSIVFNIVTKLLGGTIRVESKPGAGTTVTVRIPKKAPAPADGGSSEAIYDAASLKAA